VKDGIDWQPIDSAPLGRSILMWWRPRADPKYPHSPEAASPLSNNRYAECCVIGQVLAHEEGKWWDGREGRYQDVWHVTHWRPLPEGP
jgi:hypothetical protein